MHPASLPQRLSGEERSFRQRRIAERAGLYRFDHERMAPFAVAAEVPAEESYSVEFHTAMIRNVVATAENLAHVPATDPRSSPRHPDDYARLFPLLPRPLPFLQHYWKDWFFGEQRLAGVNPLLLRAVVDREDLARLREKMPVTDDHLRQSVTGTGHAGGRQSLLSAVDDGHLFVADYELLDELPCGRWSSGSKYVTAPVALFAWRSTGQGDRGELVPLAIQLHQRPAQDNPVFTPAADAEWRLAKLFVQVADANHHEMASHLAGTHLAVEPFAVATGRNLAPEHPVSQLLRPHLRYTMARNREAQLRLINPDGPVDELLGSTLAGSLEIARRAWRGFRAHRGFGILRSSFPQDLRSRGLDNSNRLPHYPYRDDGQLLWDAIGDYVRAYLACFYREPRDITEDDEIQAWCRDLADPHGGAVPEMPTRLHSVGELAEVLQCVLFIAGPMHAATNFPQYPAMGFVSNMPMAAYQPPPVSVGCGIYGDEYLCATLPPASLAAKQLVIVYNLSSYRHDELGNFGDSPFADDVALVQTSFRKALLDCEKRIVERNRLRRYPYEFLRPSLVPNSIAV